jgi:hypothetical protein
VLGLRGQALDEDAMTARTIIGSGPCRRTLPLGREAIERALRLCRFWKESRPRDASLQAIRPQWATVAGNSDWLPSELHRDTVEQLRERLRGYP